MPNYARLHELVSHRVTFEYDTGAKIVGYIAACKPATGPVQVVVMSRVDILDDKGRVIDTASKQPCTGEYTAGWIKRGPSGVIGTNKPDSVETVTNMLEDFRNGAILNPAQPEVSAAADLIKQRQPTYFSYADWKKLDALEVAKGQPLGRPRVKFTSVEDMIAALGK